MSPIQSKPVPEIRHQLQFLLPMILSLYFAQRVQFKYLTQYFPHTISTWHSGYVTTVWQSWTEPIANESLSEKTDLADYFIGILN